MLDKLLARFRKPKHVVEEPAQEANKAESEADDGFGTTANNNQKKKSNAHGCC